MPRPWLLSLLLLTGCPAKPDDTGAEAVDLDHDGFTTELDCDDEDATVFPGATEGCDGLDNDCDGFIDEDDPSLDGRLDMSPDSDGDGYGDASQARSYCTHPGEGWVEDASDCDDGDAAVHPGAVERCNGYDDDCDDEIDEEGALDSTWWLDSDDDGYGDPDLALVQCEQPSGYVLSDAGADCDDRDATIHPGASEHCDEVDEDCDGAVDEDAADATTWYRDGDGDGWGDDASSQQACDQPLRHVATGGDCDDDDGAIHPSASEHCDGIDEDCDGAADEGAVDAPVWHPDSDSDGYGDAASSQNACAQPSGWIANGTDCDDGDAAVHPGAAETCNGYDDDCDGLVDEGSSGGTTWYRDGDGDGHGSPSITTTACGQPSGYVAVGDDCDDTDGSTYPGALERCDGLDNDCDLTVDGAGLATFVSVYGGVTDLTATFARGSRSVAYDHTIASSGTLTFCEGTYYVHIAANGPAVTLRGLDGADVTTLAGDGSASVVTAGSGCGALTIQDLTISDGAAVDGGGVEGSDHGLDLSLLDVTIRDCGASGDGGGVHLEGGSLAAVELTLEGNSAGSEGGGLYAYDSTVTIDTANVVGNSASYGGGGLFLDVIGALAMDGLVLDDNMSGSYGGGAYVRYAAGVIVDAEVVDNEATYAGGLMFYDSLVSVQDSAIHGNEACDAGGGVYVSAGAVDLERCVVYSNVADGSAVGRDSAGGGVFLNGAAVVTCIGENSPVYGIYANQATYGGGGFIYDASSVFESDTCDWGTGSSDNSPDDFAVLVGYQAYTGYGPNEDFVCTSLGCL